MDRPDSRARWDPFHGLQREVGRFFEAFEPLHALRSGRPFPAINLFDAGDRFVLTAELPGMPAEQVDLSVTGESVMLRGERARPVGIAEESYRRQERPFGHWSRTVSLPGPVDCDRVDADLAEGILTVSLPKSEGARPRQIKVGAPAS